MKPGPATHERDWTDEQPDPTHRRINEAGDSVSSNQGLRDESSPKSANFGLPAATMALPTTPVPAVGNSKRHPRLKQQPREYLRCAQCGSDPAAHVASSDHGFMLLMGQQHGEQRSSRKASGSCAILTAGHVCSVAPYGRGDTPGAVLATAIHHFRNFVLETPLRTAGSLGIRK